VIADTARAPGVSPTGRQVGGADAMGRVAVDAGVVPALAECLRKGTRCGCWEGVDA
jgi:hypothetical protein